MSDSTGSAQNSDSGVVDWGLAVATARRLGRPGPVVPVGEARQVVADLHEYAELSEDHVRGYTQLHADGGRAPVLVVDRPGWVRANADAFSDVLEPLTGRLAERRTPGFVGGLGSRLTGMEAGALLAFLSGKVLGQFDPFWSDDQGSGGRLLLVAPNVLAVERELDVDPRDFRLWVCLHEETHRVQFTATPWLREHFREQIRLFLEQTDLDPAAVVAQLRAGAEQLGKALRGDADGSVLDLVQTPEQKEILDRLTAMMSLLEGHADVVMDGVGPEVIPTVEQIREKFQKRRSGSDSSFGDQLLKRLLGLDAKLAQYRDGAAFVRAVTDQVGMAGFNRVWESPETLPGKTEITDPGAWVRRVHGTTPSNGVPALPES